MNVSRFDIKLNWTKWLLVGGATTITVIIIYKKFTGKQRSPDPALLNYTHAGHVSNLYIYPLDMGCRYELQEAVCNDLGLCATISGYSWRDKAFIIYDELSLECCPYIPNMVKITILPDDNGTIRVSASDNPNDEIIAINIPRLSLTASPKKEISVRVRDRRQTFDCWDCGKEVADWLSLYLTGFTHRLRLGYLDHDAKRWIQSEDAKLDPIESNKIVDLNTFSLLSDYSVLEATSKERNLVFNQHFFRPNIFINEIQRSEKEFGFIKIGEVILKAEKLQICKKKTSDSESGDSYTLPNSLMKCIQTRSYDHKSIVPAMGIHVSVYRPGVIRVGDPVCVTYRSTRYNWLLGILHDLLRAYHEESTTDHVRII